MKTTILALAMGATLLPATVRADSYSDQWALEQRIDQLERDQRNAEAQYQADEFNRQQEEAQRHFEESLQRTRDQTDAYVRGLSEGFR